MRTTLIIILGLVFILNAQDRPQQESELENLQILPFTKKSEVKDFMKGMARNVGLKCRDCHDLDDKASDEKENKRTARRMMRMVGEINGNLLPEDAEHQVTCWTCHRGEKHPEENKD